MADLGIAYGKYLLLRRIASGGMAELFLAKQTGLSGFEKLVVLKRILPYLCDDDEFVRMLLDEARIAAQLSHPNIAQIYDLGKEGDSYFIAMEYVHGDDLERILYAVTDRGKTVPLKLAVRIVATVCEALYYAHRQVDLSGRPLNLVHRDVTPGNIMITVEGVVKLVDFGIAKATARLGRTRPGIVKGKFLYMSPEQVHQIEIDHRADIFSAGVLLYELCTGIRPFERSTAMEVLTAVRDDAPQPPVEVVPGFPRRLSEVILRALEKDREKRFRNCREFQVDLEAVLVSLGGTPGTMELSAFMREVFGDPARVGRGGEPPTAPGVTGPSSIPKGVFEEDRGPRLGGASPPAPNEFGLQRAPRDGARPRNLTTPQRALGPRVSGEKPTELEVATILERRPAADVPLAAPAPVAGGRQQPTSPAPRFTPQFLDATEEPTQRVMPPDEPTSGAARPRIPTGLRNLFEPETSERVLAGIEPGGGEVLLRAAGEVESSGVTLPAGGPASAEPRKTATPTGWPEDPDSTARRMSPGRRRRAAVAGFAVVVAAGVAALGVLRGGSTLATREAAEAPDDVRPPEAVGGRGEATAPERGAPAVETRLRVEIRSVPPGALVKREPDGPFLGQTPFVWMADPREAKVRFKFSLDGYADALEEADVKSSGVVWATLKPRARAPGARRRGP